MSNSLAYYVVLFLLLQSLHPYSQGNSLKAMINSRLALNVKGQILIPSVNFYSDFIQDMNTSWRRQEYIHEEEKIWNRN